MAYRIEDIDGLDEAFCDRLISVGVRTTSHFLVRWAKDRKSLEALANGDDAALRQLLCVSDLSRIQGVGTVYAMLLLIVGIDGSPTLSAARTAPLKDAMALAKDKVRGIKRLPSIAELERWIADAKSLPPVGD